MIDLDALAGCLADLGLGRWIDAIRARCEERLSPAAHGDFARWRKLIDGLPAADRRAGDLAADIVAVGTADLDEALRSDLRAALLKLCPWRKGPFSVCGVRIDAEWRSDLKWARLQDEIDPLDGRNVLDVGSGNGYYALRMLGGGARSVVGIDPTLLYVVQFIALCRFMPPVPAYVLPLRLDELPGPARSFDTTFSMGVLYHQAAPLEHLRQLRATLRPRGQLVLETIFLPGEDAYAATPPERYARMRNVWLLPTTGELGTWLRRTGFRDVRIVNESVTTVDEQRSTEWMPFESLAQALHPDDPSRTIEGWPAPRRLIALARAP